MSPPQCAPHHLAPPHLPSAHRCANNSSPENSSGRSNDAPGAPAGRFGIAPMLLPHHALELLPPHLGKKETRRLLLKALLFRKRIRPLIPPSPARTASSPHYRSRQPDRMPRRMRARHPAAFLIRPVHDRRIHLVRSVRRKRRAPSRVKYPPNPLSDSTAACTASASPTRAPSTPPTPPPAPAPALRDTSRQSQSPCAPTRLRPRPRGSQWPTPSPS